MDPGRGGRRWKVRDKEVRAGKTVTSGDQYTSRGNLASPSSIHHTYPLLSGPLPDCWWTGLRPLLTDTKGLERCANLNLTKLDLKKS